MQIRGKVYKTVVPGAAGPYYYAVELAGTLNKQSDPFATFILAHNAMITYISGLSLGGEVFLNEDVTLVTGAP